MHVANLKSQLVLLLSLIKRRFILLTVLLPIQKQKQKVLPLPLQNTQLTPLLQSTPVLSLRLSLVLLNIQFLSLPMLPLPSIQLMPRPQNIPLPSQLQALLLSTQHMLLHQNILLLSHRQVLLQLRSHQFQLVV